MFFHSRSRVPVPGKGAGSGLLECMFPLFVCLALAFIFPMAVMGRQCCEAGPSFDGRRHQKLAGVPQLAGVN